MLIVLLSLMMVMASLCRADPPEKKDGGTIYLKDADSYIGKAPLIPKVIPAPTPTPSPTSTPTSTPTPIAEREFSDDSDAVKPVRGHPPVIIHRSTLTVGQQIPVPSQYAAPQISQNNGVVVVPATPKSFETIQTGTSVTADGNGNISFQDSQLSGFVNYGSPIRAVVPLRDAQGRQTNSQVITISSNPILVPVTTTIEMK